MKQFLPLLAAALIATPAMAQLAQKPVAVQQTARQMAVKPAVTNVQLTAPIKANANVEVLRTLHEGSKGRLDLVRTADGRIAKALTREDGRMRISRPAAKKAAAQGPNFYEDFSGWDGETQSWVPNDWETKSSDDPVIEQSPATYNWHVEANEIGFLAYPKAGDYMASVYLAVDYQFEDDTMVMVYAQEDQWLISPEFTPAADEILQYALTFTPIWMYNLDNDHFDWEETLDFIGERERTASVKTLLSVDGGDWTEVHDPYNDYLDTTADELMDLGNDWRIYNVNLSQYVGKKVRVAFQYEGVNGENWGLDYVKVGIPQPEAAYQRPAGAFYYGFSDQYYSLSNKDGQSLMLIPANVPVTWTNMSNADSETFTWLYGYDQNDNELYADDVDLVINYAATPEEEYNWYDIPVLTASAEGAEDSEYSWNGLALQAGGYAHYMYDGDTEETLYGVGNYDFNNSKFTELGYDEDTPLYGVAEGIDAAWSAIFDEEISVEGVANYFEKPTIPYTLSRINISCDATFEDGAQLELTLVRMDDAGYLTDTIAQTVTTLTSDMIAFTSDGTNYTSIPFTFSTIDEDGFETEADLTISDAFMAVVNTKSATGIQYLAIFQTYYPDPLEETNGYVQLATEDRVAFYPIDVLQTSLGRCFSSFLFNLYMSYPTDPALSIEQISNEAAPVMGQQFFNISGQVVNGAAKGFIIEKTANGEFRKAIKL